MTRTCAQVVAAELARARLAARRGVPGHRVFGVRRRAQAGQRGRRQPRGGRRSRRAGRWRAPPTGSSRPAGPPRSCASESGASAAIIAVSARNRCRTANSVLFGRVPELVLPALSTPVRVLSDSSTFIGRPATRSEATASSGRNGVGVDGRHLAAVQHDRADVLGGGEVGEHGQVRGPAGRPGDVVPERPVQHAARHRLAGAVRGGEIPGQALMDQGRHVHVGVRGEHGRLVRRDLPEPGQPARRGRAGRLAAAPVQVGWPPTR